MKINNQTYPISIKLLLNCINRAITRDNHETLTGSPQKVLGVVVMFYKMFKNFKFDKDPHSYGFNDILTIPFNNEVIIKFKYLSKY